MKPVRLEVEGFTAFRGWTEVDFDGADLFALSGPTGAGKTSLIDAMTFALYGSVPRLDAGAVAPVVSQGLAECRIRFAFTVGGEPYVAVRVVRTTKAGATTKEARLEHGDGTVLAGDAKALTAAVTELLGLDFKQFTTCVSLPQGEFARFLHAEPRHRQDLLVKLLDLGLYAEVGTVARQRAALAEQSAKLATARLEKLADATAEAKADAAAQVTALTGLLALVKDAEPELATARAAEAAATAAAEAAGEALALLASVRVPPSVGELSARVAAATAARAAAAEAEEAAAVAVAEAEAAVAALPARSGLEAVQRDRAAAAELEERVAKGQQVVADAAAAEHAAQTMVEAAVAAEATAAEHLAAVRTAHAAHAIASTLQIGDDCPVCGQVVAELPVIDGDVHSAESAAISAAATSARVREEAVEAAKKRASMEELLAERVKEQARLLDALASAPSPTEVAAALAVIDAAETALAERRRQAEAARQARAAADREVAEAGSAEASARRAFDAARDAVARLDPPSAERVDLAADWAALAAWAAEARPAHLAEQQGQLAAAEAHRRAAAAVNQQVVAACTAVGVEPGSDPRGAVADAIARAEAEVRRIDDAMAEAAELRAASAGDLAAAAIASTLAGHLKADRFERWLLAEALAQLVAGATQLLHELSGNAYSLAVDEKGAFVVVDHVNAEQVRSARTLSGGETFLASLALALALADQVATLAAGGAARLETMLLDEGFGSLDPDALDTVAAALEELGASGRTVGIVTHVQELAERMPVRFEVRKVAGSATVTRVSA